MSSRSLTNHFKSIGLLLAVLAFSALASLPAAAQERFGSIGGTVTDTTKAAVPGATINVTNKENGAIRTTVSGADGTFRIPDVPPGRYTVTIELSGFQKANVDDVIVLLGREVSINHELQTGAVTETVNVVGDTRQVDLKSVTLQHNVTAEELDRIPKTRSFQGIALTAPGVNAGEIEAGFQVHGASGSENSFVVDGVVTNSLVDGRSRQATLFDYLQVAPVKTSGINA